jgi:hypothetical protein
MRRTLLLLAFSAVLLSALPVLAQPVSNNAQRIVQTDGTHIDAASPLPITGTVTATMGASTQLPATLGAKAPGASLSVTQDTTGGWTATTTATEDKGAGNVSATTIRVVTAADSPDVDHLNTIETYTGASQAYDATLNLAVQTEAAAKGTRSVLIGGADGGGVARSVLTDTSGNLQVELPSEDRGRETGTANTLRTAEATCSQVQHYAGTVTGGTSIYVIAARSTRCSLECQNKDADSALGIVRGTADTACLDGGVDVSFWLNPGSAAYRAGGSLDDGKWGGAVTICVPENAKTITYTCDETY